MPSKVTSVKQPLWNHFQIIIVCVCFGKENGLLKVPPFVMCSFLFKKKKDTIDSLMLLAAFLILLMNLSYSINALIESPMN